MYELGRHFLTFDSAKITYTTTAGDRLTESVALSSDEDVAGSWPVDAATGATVVFESTYRFRSEPFDQIQGDGDVTPNSITPIVLIDATGLDRLIWRNNPIGGRCLYSCSSFYPLVVLEDALS